MLGVDFVECLKVVKRAEEASCLHNVVQRAAGGLQDSLQVLEDLLRLLADASGAEKSGGQQGNLSREKKPGTRLGGLAIRPDGFRGTVGGEGGFGKRHGGFLSRRRNFPQGGGSG